MVSNHRKIATLMTLLSELGGLMKSLTFGVALIMGYLNNRIHLENLI